MRTAHQAIAVFTARLPPLLSLDPMGRAISKGWKQVRDDAYGRQRGMRRRERRYESAAERREGGGGYSPRRVKMRGRRNTSGKGTDDYWAPKPRITGITPGICNRVLGRQSATDFAAIPLSLSLSLCRLLFVPRSTTIRTAFPFSPCLKLCSSVSGTLFNRATFLLVSQKICKLYG